MTEKRITQIEELCKKTTAGPWAMILDMMMGAEQEGGNPTIIIFVDKYGDLAPDDLEFIEQSRTIVLEMAAEIRRVQDVLKRISRLSELPVRILNNYGNIAREALEEKFPEPTKEEKRRIEE